MNAAAPYLDALRDMAPLVAAEAERSEREARTTPAVNERIVEEGLYRLWLPRSIDAPELDMPPALEVFEAASRLDGSFGWAVTIGTGAGLFAGALEPATKAEIFGPREALIAGSGKPGGTAKPVDGGYLAGGHWNFASGAHHATFFTANCVLEGERPADGGDGPVIRAMAFPASEVEIVENWDPVGMRGTGSHDFRVESSLVPYRRTFGVFDDWPFESGPLYRYPFNHHAEVSFAAVALGIGRHAIDEFLALAGSRRTLYTGEPLEDRQGARVRLGEAEALVSAARAWFFEVARSSWDTVVAGGALEPEEASRVSLASIHAANSAARAAMLLFEAGGSAALDAGSPLARAWRDVHALTKHVAVSPLGYEAAAAGLLEAEE
ncbi:MAG: acyl-CoA dehydrogenase family protein [Chloroflexi bacterium]|nr:acyl-CoA dehydrogenase family protein [Chloroflexota bacterium]